MIQSIKSNIFEYFLRYYQQAIIFTIAVMLIIGIVYRINLHIKKQHIIVTREWICKMVYLAILFFYIYFVIGITILSRVSTEIPVVNLKLFSTFQDDYHSRLYMYENVLLFVPFTMLLYLIFKRIRKSYCFFIIGILTSLSIEIVQYITRRGFCEVDDIFTNVVGMMLGYIIVFTWHQGIKLAKKKQEMCNKRI